MPIFVYEPVPTDDQDQPSEPKECCHFETLQWSNEPPLTQCPDCGGAIRRAITGFSVATQAQRDPLKGVAQKIGEGLAAGHEGATAAEKSEAKSIISGSASNTPAGRAARLAYKHVCSGNCRH